MNANTHALLLRNALCAALAALAPSAVAVAAQDRADDWQSPNERCEPACRSGFTCRRGECLPMCSPACADGQACSAAGSCFDVALPPPATLKHTRERDAQACSPGCRDGYTCVANRCLSLCNPICSPGEMCTNAGECEPYREYPEPETATVPNAPASSLVNLHIDVLGALQFGLTPTVEVGGTVSGFVRLRALNTGVGSYFLLGRNRDDDLSFGLGAALGGHVFFTEQGNTRGVFAGLALEYVFLQTKETGVDFARHRTHVLVPELDVGYRWAFGALLVDIGGRLGLAIPVSDQSTPIGDAGCVRPGSCAAVLDATVFPSVFLDLGWFIPRS